MAPSSRIALKSLVAALLLSFLAMPSAMASTSKRLYYSDGVAIKYVDLATEIETTVVATNCSGSTATTDIYEIEVDAQNEIVYICEKFRPKDYCKT